MCVCERERVHVCVCVCVREKDSMYVCVCERESEYMCVDVLYTSPFTKYLIKSINHVSFR